MRSHAGDACVLLDLAAVGWLVLAEVAVTLDDIRNRFLKHAQLGIA